MNLQIDQPLWIWATVATLPLVAIALAWFRSMTALRRWSAVITRSILVALIAVLLAGASSVRTTDTLAVVAVVDVSESVRRFGAPAAATGGERAPGERASMDALRLFIQSLASQRGPDDLLGVVVFDGASISVANPTRAQIDTGAIDVRLRSGSNIADALRLARGLIPPDAAARLVLVSDGNQTQGDALAAARESAGSGLAPTKPIPIDVAPIRYALAREVSLEALDAPAAAPAGGIITLRALIEASEPAEGSIILLREGVPFDLNGDEPGTGRRVRLRAGENIEAFEVPLGDGRVHRFQAVFEPDVSEAGTTIGDTTPENNSADAFTVTPGRGSILLVDGVEGGEAATSGTLARTLRESGLDVRTVQPGGVPETLLGLQEFDLVILQSVAADTLSQRTQDALATFVRDMGGGLVMVGGPGSFAAGGWKGSVIEPMLPVKLDLPERLVVPDAAIILVLDNSGSMRRWVMGTGRSQQEIANEAAALAIKSLDPRDLVGVITFNSTHDTVIPLAPNRDPRATADRMLEISSDGGTEILSPLQAALTQMETSAGSAKVRQIILLTDGVSRSKKGLLEIADAIANEDIRLSTIAVGDETDAGTLSEMARRGGGSYYHATQAQMLPKLLLKAVRVVRTPLLREEPFVPVLLPSGSPVTTGLEPSIPPLGGLVLTQPRAEQGIVNAIVTPGGEPVLAHWTVGLGQVAAFTSDAHRWAGPWLGWPGYRQLWTQLARTTARASSGQGLRGTIASDGQSLLVRVDATDERGKPLDDLAVSATLYGPSGAPTELGLSGVGPGAYEARVPAGVDGSYLALVKPVRDGRPISPLLLGRSVTAANELRERATNLALLESIASSTGGRIIDPANADATRVFDRTGIAPREALTPLTKLLLAWALVVLMIDIATRRVAWDRWFSRAFRPELAQTLREQGARAAQATATLGGLRAAMESSATDPARGDAGTLEAVPRIETATSLALGEQEAALLVKAARDRRRAQRLGEARQTAESPPPPSQQARSADGVSRPESGPDTPGEGGLLAAKRRARERFTDEAG
jgi:uncharacterized membrane protein